MKSKLNPVGDTDNEGVCCFWNFDDVACYNWNITREGKEYNYICIGKKGRCR